MRIIAIFVMAALAAACSSRDAGPQKLADIVDGGTFLLSTLDSVLPETSSLLRSSRVVFTMVADKNAGIDAASDNLSGTFAGINAMRDGYRRLTQQAPETLAHVDNLFADNSDTMVQLLGNLATTSRLLYLRVPALNALFRTEPLDVVELAVCLGMSSVVFFAVEGEKWLMRRGRLYGEPATLSGR